MKIAILGASGLLGLKLMRILSKNHEVVGTYLRNSSPELYPLDATDESKVEEFLIKHNPDIVIDTIALTSSVACEKDQELAKKYNYETAKNISRACKKTGSYLVFISSSYIFDGEEGDYSEEDSSEPTNQYGKTKIMAEKEVLNMEKGIVLRIDILYGYNGKNYNNGILGNILSNKDIFVGNSEQIRQPLFVDDIVEIILSLVVRKQSGIFNVAGPDKISMLDFMRRLEKLMRRKSKIHILKEKELLVKPLKNSTLDTSKIQTFNVKIHSFEDGLEKIKIQMRD
jgi:dTDP-4-dehydrorhamnose reductase